MALLLAAFLLATPVPPEAAPGSGGPSIPLVVTGTAVFYVSYGTAAAFGAVYGALIVPFIAATHSHIPTEPFLLFLPVAGPPLLARTDALSGERGLNTLLWIDGGVQAVGLILIVAGFTSHSRDQADWQPWAGPGVAGVVHRW